MQLPVQVTNAEKRHSVHCSNVWPNISPVCFSRATRFFLDFLGLISSWTVRFFGQRNVVTMQHCRGTARNDEGEVNHDKDVLKGFFCNSSVQVQKIHGTFVRKMHDAGIWLFCGNIIFFHHVFIRFSSPFPVAEFDNFVENFILCVEKDLYSAKRDKFQQKNSSNVWTLFTVFSPCFLAVWTLSSNRSQSNIAASHRTTRCQKCQRIDSPRLDLRTTEFFPCHSPLREGSPMSIAPNQLQGFFCWKTRVWLAWRTLCFLRGRDGCHYT